MIKDFDELYSKLTQHIDDKNRDTVDLLKQDIKAAKTELREEFRTTTKEIRQEMHVMKDEILTGVGEMLDGGITPQIEEHENRLLKLEDKIAA
ncbi:MAG: hypothetical protein WC802_04205 [Patescibacteria group bacterium]|jgi:hypothetical protein